MGQKKEGEHDLYAANEQPNELFHFEVNTSWLGSFFVHTQRECFFEQLASSYEDFLSEKALRREHWEKDLRDRHNRTRLTID